MFFFSPFYFLVFCETKTNKQREGKGREISGGDDFGEVMGGLGVVVSVW